LALRTIVQQHPAEQEEVGYLYNIPWGCIVRALIS
jgi:hypothetical protein